MSIDLLVDMNLSPDWVAWFSRHQVHAIHWSSIGDPRASDQVIVDWAREHRYIIFTHDLDFGALLALTNEDGPSVLQVRTQDVFPEHLGRFVLAAILQNQAALEKGALVVLNENTLKVRILPLHNT